MTSHKIDEQHRHQTNVLNRRFVTKISRLVHHVTTRPCHLAWCPQPVTLS